MEIFANKSERKREGRSEGGKVEERRRRRGKKEGRKEETKLGRRERRMKEGGS